MVFGRRAGAAAAAAAVAAAGLDSTIERPKAADTIAASTDMRTNACVCATVLVAALLGVAFEDAPVNE